MRKPHFCANGFKDFLSYSFNSSSNLSTCANSGGTQERQEGGNRRLLKSIEYMKLQLLSLKSLSSFIFLTKEVYSECTITVFSYSSLSFILYKVCDSRLIYIIELDKFLNKYIFFVPRKALKLHLLCVKQFDLLTWDCSGETPFFCAIYLFNVTQFGGISILSQYFHYFYLSQRITTLNWNFL